MGKKFDMSRILVLSISRRSGHQHAAMAVENSLKTFYSEVEVLTQNFFDCIKSPYLEQMINSTYLSILKTTPEIWDYLYDNEKVAERISHLRNITTKQAANKFHHVLQEIKPSAIVCTQAFPCEVYSSLKRDVGIRIPLVAVVTDFVANAYWIHPEVDLYTVPSEYTKQGLVESGVDPDKVKVLGIPIKPVFEKEYSNEERLKLKRELGFDSNLPIVLIMGGSQGLGPFRKMINILSHHNEKIQLVVITGLNTKMRRSLTWLKKSTKIPIHVFGYINNVHDLMSVSDILISKPGGMTTTEALAKNLPMIMVQPLPGQEEKNCRFLLEKKAALRIDDMEDITNVIRKLIHTPEMISELKYHMEKLVVKHSGQLVADAIMAITSNQEIPVFLED